MSAARKLLESIGDNELFTGREVKRMLGEATCPPETLTTSKAAEYYGWSPKSWLKWAMSGEVWTDVPGAGRVEAWQNEAGAPWNLPRMACEAHVARLRQRANLRRSRLRGPRNAKSQGLS